MKPKTSKTNPCCAFVSLVVLVALAIPACILGYVFLLIYEDEAPRRNIEAVSYQALPEALDRFNRHYEEILSDFDPSFYASEVSKDIYNDIYLQCIRIQGYFVYKTNVPFKLLRDEFHDYFKGKNWQVEIYNYHPLKWHYRHKYEDIGEMMISVKEFTETQINTYVWYEISVFYSEPYIGACI